MQASRHAMCIRSGWGRVTSAAALPLAPPGEQGGAGRRTHPLPGPLKWEEHSLLSCRRSASSPASRRGPRASSSSREGPPASGPFCLSQSSRLHLTPVSKTPISLSRSCPHLTIPAAGSPAQTASCCYLQPSSLLLSGNSVRLYNSHTTSLLRTLEERLPLRLREQERPCLLGPTLGHPAAPGLASCSSPACSPALQPRRSPRCP